MTGAQKTPKTKCALNKNRKMDTIKYISGVVYQSLSQHFLSEKLIMSCYSRYHQVQCNLWRSSTCN